MPGKILHFYMIKNAKCILSHVEITLNQVLVSLGCNGNTAVLICCLPSGSFNTATELNNKPHSLQGLKDPFSGHHRVTLLTPVVGKKRIFIASSHCEANDLGAVIEPC